MRPILSIAAVIATLAATASPAAADWSFTRWGMTPAQVVRASGGTARLQDEAPLPGQTWIIKAKGTVRSGDLLFDADYRFKDNRLVDVTLTLKQGECGSMLRALRSKYGTPLPRNQFMPWMTKWASSSENVRVQAEVRSSECLVAYNPLTDSNSAGL